MSARAPATRCRVIPHRWIDAARLIPRWPRRSCSRAFAWNTRPTRCAPTTPDVRGVVLALEADLPVRDAAHDAADVVFVVRDARDGRVVASGTDTMRLPAQAAPGASAGVATFHVQFDLPPGTYLMRTVVREPGGTIGSADRRLEVRPFSGPDISVSDLVLGSATGSLPVRAQAYSEDGLAGMLEAYARAGDQLQRLSITAALVPAGIQSTRRNRAGSVVRARGCRRRRASTGDVLPPADRGATRHVHHPRPRPDRATKRWPT